jgi:hypothetical protein
MHTKGYNAIQVFLKKVQKYFGGNSEFTIRGEGPPPMTMGNNTCNNLTITIRPFLWVRKYKSEIKAEQNELYKKNKKSLRIIKNQ